MSHGALEGLRVVDATQMLAGPLAATRLGDMGADVIKLESPGSGEFNRTHGFDDVRVGGEMTTFLSVNRNKRSLALNAKDPDALDALMAVLRHADVFLQNFRHGTAERLGLGYQQLAAINPRLVYCSISGYGPEGPYRDRPGQDLVLQGYSGSLFSVGKDDDPPSPSALWAADVGAGYQATAGILAALYERERSGRGQHVEVDMFTTVLDFQLQELVTYLNAGTMPRRTRETSAHGSLPAPYGIYRTADGWLAVAMAPLPALGEVLQDELLRTLTAYNDGHDRRDEIYARIRDRFADRTTGQWLALCDQYGVWAGPVYDYAQVEADPHVRATGMIVEQPHHSAPPLRTIRPPIRMSRTDSGIRLGAPALGEHSREVLLEAGVPASRIDGLEHRGVIQQWKRSNPETIRSEMGAAR